MQNRLIAVAAALLTAVLMAGCGSQTPEQALKAAEQKLAAAAPAEWEAYKAAQEAEKALKTILAEVEATRKAVMEEAMAQQEALKTMAPAEWEAYEATEKAWNEAWKAWEKATEKALKTMAPAEWEAYEAARKALIEARKAWEKATEKAEAIGAAQKAYLEARKALIEARKAWEKVAEKTEEEALKAMAPAEWEAYEEALQTHQEASMALNKTIRKTMEKEMEKARKAGLDEFEAEEEALKAMRPMALEAHQEALEKTGWNLNRSLENLENLEKAGEKIFLAELAYEAAQAALRTAAPTEWKAYEEAQARQN